MRSVVYAAVSASVSTFKALSERAYLFPFFSEELTFSAFCDILSVVELLPFVSDVPARVFALADGVRPPLF